MKKNKNFWESAKLNNCTYQQYYNRLMELAISMFEWKNVPETIDVRFLELALFSDGKAVFFYDDDIGYLALRCMLGGDFNVYEIPLKRTAYGANGYMANLTHENSVIIYNNLLHTNSMLDTEMFARRLYNIDRIIDVNINAQKTPILIKCSENQRLTLKNLYMQYDGNEPVIFGDKDLNTNPLQTLKTDAPFLADKLSDIKARLWNESLTYLGISNTNMVKKERMLRDEVLRNQGGTIASRYSRLESRRQACTKINEMFNLDIWCDYRADYMEFTTTELEQAESGEGDINE